MVFLGDIPFAIRAPRQVFEDFFFAVGARDSGLLIGALAVIIGIIGPVFVVLVLLPIGVHF
jgi:hypothetical protein